MLESKLDSETSVYVRFAIDAVWSLIKSRMPTPFDGSCTAQKLRQDDRLITRLSRQPDRRPDKAYIVSVDTASLRRSVQDKNRSKESWVPSKLRVYVDFSQLSKLVKVTGLKPKGELWLCISLSHPDGKYESLMQEVKHSLYYTCRHEVEHGTNHLGDFSKQWRKSTTGSEELDDDESYFDNLGVLSDHDTGVFPLSFERLLDARERYRNCSREIEAEGCGCYYYAKKNRISVEDAVNRRMLIHKDRFLDSYKAEITPEEESKLERSLESTRRALLSYIRRRFPKANIQVESRIQEALKESYLVLWSGGYDSTYLIQHLLEEGHTVYAAYISLENNPEKTERETAAVNQMIPIVKGMGDFFWMGNVANVGVNVIPSQDKLKFRQFPVWVSNIILLVNSNELKVDKVALGYVGGGRTAPHLEDFVSIYKSYESITSESLPELCFPLRNMSKLEIDKALDPRLKAHCTHCERPQKDEKGYRDCGSCNPCITRSRAMRSLPEV